MNGKFFDLPKEKQDRMINAALKVFALQGYRHACTDDIVREASISKGLLFHYFGSKLGVYTFVYDYSVRYMTLELRTTVHTKERNLFEVLRQIEEARTHAMRNYPYMQMFLDRCETEDVKEALLAVEERKAALQEQYDSIEQQIDYSRLHAFADAQKVRRMLDYTIRGLMMERFREDTFHPEMLYEEIAEYLDMMKKILS
ncbi:MAG: TetR/AcrR family transcriptional regulator [Lachnospiraceae bacterium]|nr:TetR/AcrR family transcriptional regulator [Lachnospiraceae bacterium]